IGNRPDQFIRNVCALFDKPHLTPRTVQIDPQLGRNDPHIAGPSLVQSQYLEWLLFWGGKRPDWRPRRIALHDRDARVIGKHSRCRIGGKLRALLGTPRPVSPTSAPPVRRAYQGRFLRPARASEGTACPSSLRIDHMGCKPSSLAAPRSPQR